MAEVATQGPKLPSSNPLQLASVSGNGGSSEATAAIKRKSPSELRENVTADHNDGLKNPSVSKKLTAERQPWCSSLKDSHTSTTGTKEARTTQSYNATKECSGSTFRSVIELSSGSEMLSGLSVDMDKAFKGLAARMHPSIPAPAESLNGNTNPASVKFCSEIHIPGINIPLDFTLKTSMRVVSSSSVNWFHRLMNCGTLTAQNCITKTLYSWMHPHCSLPASVITALASSVKHDVCTVQFVAMFVNGNGSMESPGVCNAYLSQSTRTLRSLLKEQSNRTISVSNVDNTPESLLEFSGNNNVHGLYDFLLNYSIEIKDAYLPPWIIKSLCDTLVSDGGDFEASFVTDPMTVGLNVVLDIVCQESNDNADSERSLLEKHSSFGITSTVISPHLSHAFVKRLNYSDQSYTLSLSPI